MWQRRCPPTLYDYKFKMAATKSEQEITITVGDCDRRDSKLGCVQIFDHGPLWLVMTRIGLRGHLMPWRTWIDVARWYIALPKLKMAAIKSEVEKTNERREMHAPRFQPIPPYNFGNAWLEYHTVEIVRHCQTLVDYRKSRWRPSETANKNWTDWSNLHARFQRLLHHLRPCRTRLWHCRYWPTL